MEVIRGWSYSRETGSLQAEFRAQTAKERLFWREGIMNVVSEGEISDEPCLADTFITEILPQELGERLVLS